MLVTSLSKLFDFEKKSLVLVVERRYNFRVCILICLAVFHILTHEGQYVVAGNLIEVKPYVGKFGNFGNCLSYSFVVFTMPLAKRAHRLKNLHN